MQKIIKQKFILNRFKNISLVVFVLVINTVSYSQAHTSDTGKVELVQDYKIKELLNKHVLINAETPVKGYRIKIHFGADKNKAKEIKTKFITRFPDVPAYEKYDQPNFNIRVGDFRTKLEAYKFLKEVQIEFPSAFLVQDEIELPKLD
ncbi:MAG: SPOR domain-containing protein [Bacteroidota bacterium]